MDKKDEIQTNGKPWKFDKEVTEVFDNMLERSIPQYQTMRELVKRIGFRYAKVNTYIVDIGCSNGNAVEPFVRKFGEDNKFMLLDVSEPMLESCRAKYEKFGRIDIQNYDIRNGIPKVDASLVLSVLTLQFTPIEYRQKIVKSIYDSLRPGGAFIIVEKVLGNTSEIDDLMVDEYYHIKSENAYTEEQIKSKRKSLEGVLVPITARWNEDMLRETGFKNIDCFWRCLNFAAWIAVK